MLLLLARSKRPNRRRKNRITEELPLSNVRSKESKEASAKTDEKEAASSSREERPKERHNDAHNNTRKNNNSTPKRPAMTAIGEEDPSRNARTAPT